MNYPPLSTVNILTPSFLTYSIPDFGCYATLSSRLGYLPPFSSPMTPNRASLATPPPRGRQWLRAIRVVSGALRARRHTRWRDDAVGLPTLMAWPGRQPRRGPWPPGRTNRHRATRRPCPYRRAFPRIGEGSPKHAHACREANLCPGPPFRPYEGGQGRAGRPARGRGWEGLPPGWAFDILLRAPAFSPSPHIALV